jgi:hypothetical protein
MSPETKSLVELEELASNLRKQITRNSVHSRIEQVLLDDVESWLKLRRKEAVGSPSNDIAF